METRNIASFRYAIHFFLALAVAAGCSSEELDPVGDGGGGLEILSFVADPATIEVDEAAVLRWSTRRAERIVLSQGDEVLLDSRSQPNGVLEVSPSVSAAYQLQAFGSGGTEKSQTVTVGVQPRILELLVDAEEPLVVGHEVEVSWKTAGATALRLSNGNGFDQAIPAGEIAAGSILAPVDATGVFVLLATSGDLEATETLSLETVVVDPPTVGSFTAAPDELTRGVEGTIQVAWSTSGADEIQLLLDGEELYAGDEASHEMELTVRLDGPEQLELVVTNRAGTITREVELEVVEPAEIEIFSASASAVLVGEGYELFWTTENAEELVLEQDGEILDPVLLGFSELPLNGSLSRTMATDTTYRLRAFNRLRHEVDATFTVSLQAPPGPEVELTATPNPYDVELHDGIVLSWTCEPAASLTIYELDEEGAPLSPALLHTEDAGEILGGSIPLDPDATTTFRAVAVSDLGGVGTVDLTVEVLRVEITSFTADPTDVFVGGFSTLSWTTERAESVELLPSTGFEFELGNLPFIELRDNGTSTELTPTACTPGYANGCEDLVFPAGFSFDLDGVSYDRARIHTNGVLSFDLTHDGPSASNPEIPTSAGGWTQLLAPFWDTLSGANAKLLWDTGTDDDGFYLAIEWSRFAFGQAGRVACPRETSFQVLLREGGRFEYRYGPTGEPNGNCIAISPTVGFQFAGGDSGLLLHYNQELAGGFPGRSYRFMPDVTPLNGEKTTQVSETKEFTLVAHGAKGRVSTRTITLRAHRAPELVGVRTYPEVLSAGDPVTIEWTTTDVASLDVVDQGGNVICPAAQSSLPRGGCTVSEATAGSYSYTVRAFGSFGDPETRQVNLSFHDPVRIEAFSVDQAEVEKGNGTAVTLSWETVGATAFSLRRDEHGESSEIAVERGNWASGSVQITPESTATFTLTVEGAPGVEREATQVVAVRTFRFEERAPTLIQSVGNVPVVLEWGVEGGARPEVDFEPKDALGMMEVFDAPFQDISLTGTPIADFHDSTAGGVTPVLLDTVRIDFPPGFEFPYFGESYDFAVMAVAGYLSFDPTAADYNGPGVNQPLANRTSLRVNIAPFWHNFRVFDRGAAYQRYVQVPGDPARDHLILQWTKMQHYVNPAPAPADQTDDFTFQALLFRDGSIEFRYGNMVSDKHPEVAGGQSASIGFQDPVTASQGVQVIYNLSNPMPWSGRSFRYAIPQASDRIEVSPSRTTEYEVCGTLEGFTDCRTIVVVVPSAGDLIVTELQLQSPGNGGTQWFELRNVTPYPVDLRGMELQTPAGSHVITSLTPVEVPPYGYRTLGTGNGAKGTFQPDYAYGLADFLPRDGRLLLSNDGREIASVTLDNSWTIPPHGGLSLEPVHHLVGTLSNDDPARWCESTEGGSPHAGEGCASPYYEIDPYSSMPFLDIEQSGTRIGSFFLGSKTVVIPGGLGFTMPFFGETVDRVWATVNGFASFRGSPEIGGGIEELPATGSMGNGMVAAYWALLKQEYPLWGPKASFAFAHREIEGEKLLILQWSNVKKVDTGVNIQEGWMSFQIQLWENGDIVTAYRDMFIHPDHFGANATVGLEAIGGGEAINFLHDLPLLQPGQSIHYRRR